MISMSSFLKIPSQSTTERTYIINMETNGSKNWWNLVKSLLHSDSGGDRSIPPLQVENDMIQDDNKKVELLLRFL
jgi:hypothetical protein